VASNGTVEAKTWNSNGLAAVANLPCHGRQTATLVLTLPIPHHKPLTDANGFGRQVNSMFLG
jgi:hypothetical protein